MFLILFIYSTSIVKGWWEGVMGRVGRKGSWEGGEGYGDGERG